MKNEEMKTKTKNNKKDTLLFQIKHKDLCAVFILPSATIKELKKTKRKKWNSNN